MRRTLLPLCLLIAIAAPARGQVEVRPLSDILLDLKGRSEGQAKRIARDQAEQQWKMDMGPVFKSTPPINNDPKKVVQEVIFEGFFTPRSASTQLAIFSDDGCEVTIDGQPVLTNFAKGQHLPTLAQSFHVLSKYQAIAGKECLIRVRYSNTIFLGPQDIDGCTLFAYQGGGATPAAHIETDVNRDGKIDEKDTRDLKEKVGTIVIRDHDKVYGDDAKEEPARRREIKLSISNGKDKKIVLQRGANAEDLAANLRVFDDSSVQKGAEIKFNDKNEATLTPKGDAALSLWLQGGPKASAKVRDQFLKVRVDGQQAFNESLSVTVLWVDLTARNTGNLSSSENGVYDGFDSVKTLVGVDPVSKVIRLGVQRSEAESRQKQT